MPLLTLQYSKFRLIQPKIEKKNEARFLNLSVEPLCSNKRMFVNFK